MEFAANPDNLLRIYYFLIFLSIFTTNGQEFVDQIAQATSGGWKNNLINRLASVSKPKASIWFTYWLILPGKIRTKNNPVTTPTIARYFLKINAVVIRSAPSVISTKPDATTTKSGSNGNQVGTWAKNSIRFEPRWLVPAESKKAPSSVWSKVFINAIG